MTDADTVFLTELMQWCVVGPSLLLAPWGPLESRQPYQTFSLEVFFPCFRCSYPGSGLSFSFWLESLAPTPLVLLQGAQQQF